MKASAGTPGRVAIGGLAALTAMLAAACSNILGLGELVYDVQPAAGGGQGGSGGGGGGGHGGGGGNPTGGGGIGGTGGSSGGQGGVAGGGGVGGEEPAAPPLQLDGDVGNGLVAAFVESQFRLELQQSLQWQIGAWYDLTSDPALDLAGASPYPNVLVEPFEINYEGSWYGTMQASNGAVVLANETPARAVFATTMDSAPSGVGLEIQTIYTVWATGRVGIDATLLNASGSTRSIPAVEYNHHHVSQAVSWARSVLASEHAVSFVRADGPTPLPNLLVVNHGVETPAGQDYGGNVYWDAGAVTLDPTQTFRRRAELVIHPGGLDAAALTSRANDALAPGLAIVQGATAVGTGYDPGQAAYVVTAQGSAVDLRLTSAADRHAPAFVVQSFPYDSFTVRLAGEDVVRSDRLSGAHGHAHYDADADQLVFVYLDTIPTTATDEQRTFELRGQ